MVSILHLTLNKKLFDMINSGEKKEAYIEIRDYWVRRLVWLKPGTEMECGPFREMIEDMRDPFHSHKDVDDLMDYFGVEFKRYESVTFRNRFSKNTSQFSTKISGISISKGRIIWGAVPNKYYFVVSLLN